MAREKGSFSFSGNFEVAKKGALDARTYCPTYADMLAFTSTDLIYNGHVVTVWDADPTKRGLYRCINEADLSNAASWQKVGDDVDLTAYEKKVNKNVANGYAGLDSTGLIPSSILPSYVDDVIERANLAAMPATGETGKIYVTLDTNKTYRWSGSAYVEISASPGSTDAVTEGSVNLYFTEARVRATPLTGLTSTTGNPAATDSVLTAWGKVLNFINNIAATIRTTVLTGFSSTNSAITAADTILSATGKAQGQITALQGNIPTVAEMQTETPTNDTKFVTPSKLATWWATVKAGVSYITFGTISFNTVGNASPTHLQFWYDGFSFIFRQGTASLRLLWSGANPSLAGDGNRLLEVDSTGVPIAATKILAEDTYVTDADIVNACVAASYLSANGYIASIPTSSMNGKQFYGGCFCLSGEYKYEAIADGTVIRYKISL